MSSTYLHREPTFISKSDQFQLKNGHKLLFTAKCKEILQNVYVVDESLMNKGELGIKIYRLIRCILKRMRQPVAAIAFEYHQSLDAIFVSQSVRSPSSQQPTAFPFLPCLVLVFSPLLGKAMQIANMSLYVAGEMQMPFLLRNRINCLQLEIKTQKPQATTRW